MSEFQCSSFLCVASVFPRKINWKRYGPSSKNRQLSTIILNIDELKFLFHCRRFIVDRPNIITHILRANGVSQVV